MSFEVNLTDDEVQMGGAGGRRMRHVMFIHDGTATTSRRTMEARVTVATPVLTGINCEESPNYSQDDAV